ncbi:hypothetical protein G5714_000542 [Onychostoma macrolepis]|uniref:Uncharacterized protein n=1 Tax=Onychostoma macrolepis TaxID=369639 RepID=A0A7J6DHC4_9TELE|nr:hypothetical protein G5714_000542 [Onychostoma macrolepis]
MPRSLEEVWISDSYVLCGRVSSPVVVTSSTGCVGNNAVRKGAGIRFDSLEHEALEDADLLEHQRVLESGTRRCGPGVGAKETQNLVDLLVSHPCRPDTQIWLICCYLPCNRPKTQNGVSFEKVPLSLFDEEEIAIWRF